MKLNVSLYIPVYNGESTIKSVLKSTFALNPGPDEIIVINDGSTDNTFAILKSYKNKINIINNKSNIGLAASRNLGVLSSKNEDVASIDADVVVSEDWLENLYQTKKKFNSALCGGKLIEKYKDKNIYNFWRHVHARQNPFGEKDIENINRALAGSNILVSKTAWKKIRGYNTIYKTHGEDFSFCNKILSYGYKISYSGKAKSYHLRDDNLKSLCTAVRKAYIYGAGLKKPSFMRFLQRSIRHFKNFILFSIKDLKYLRLVLIYLNFMIFINHVVKEFIGLIKKKSDYA